ncbi:unnamed protein product [Parnassius apollo]|uniref:(apollo) hypothetical protein n=1 Tax=Parnassius apollo TaxID=110799 RepID=A0A8S3X3Y2_PARAO|nr:unnamed protein product [Parnassius apollo]
MLSEDISMCFGLDKWQTISTDRGKVRLSEGYCLQNGGIINSMTKEETYKYLGLLQSLRVDDREIRTRVTTEYHRRLKAILKSGLNGKNTFKAINTFAIPVLMYTFGIVKWSNAELESVERSTRVLLTKYRIHHPKSAVERITLPRTEGGRGLIDIKRQHTRKIENLQQYFWNKESSPLHRIVYLVDDRLSPLDLLHAKDIEPSISDVNHVKNKLSQWASKAIHGRFAHELKKTNLILLPQLTGFVEEEYWPKQRDS